MRGHTGDLAFDWNDAGRLPAPSPGVVSFDDETLRDGLQSPSARHPSLDERIGFVELAASLGITSADVGLPGAVPAPRRTPRRCATRQTSCRTAARTAEADIRPILEAAHGRRSSSSFLASPIRCHVEDGRWPISSGPSGGCHSPCGEALP
jgi:2-isopropylmalate synthase